jgi:hypothetical protein
VVLGRGTASNSSCCRPAAQRGGRAELRQRRGGVVRVEGSQRRGARAAAGLDMTHGSYPSRKWCRQSCSGGEQRRPATAERGQLGRTAERRGVLGEGQQEEVRRWASSGATRGAALEQEVASGGAAQRPAAVLRRSRGEAGEQEAGD